MLEKIKSNINRYKSISTILLSATNDLEAYNKIVKNHILLGTSSSAFVTFRELEHVHPRFNYMFKQRIDMIQKNEEFKNQNEIVIEVLNAEKEQYLGILEDRAERLNALIEEKMNLDLNSKKDKDSLQYLISVMQDSIIHFRELIQYKVETEKEYLVIFNMKGNEIHYLGEVKNGKANGKGIGIWKSGGIYKGEWKDNMRHGKGQYQWKDGELYVGDYYYDTRHGHGKYTWVTGIYYIGNWKEDKREGQGTLFEKTGEIRFTGTWANDEFKKSDS
ncbi:MAG TPA: hypothetical protein PKC30_02085 [Saprospiraceae bacterium]|nr:hypothetical protein [Saprospiraceae bacterium]